MTTSSDVAQRLTDEWGEMIANYMGIDVGEIDLRSPACVGWLLHAICQHEVLCDDAPRLSQDHWTRVWTAELVRGYARPPEQTIKHEGETAGIALAAVLLDLMKEHT